MIYDMKYIYFFQSQIFKGKHLMNLYIHMNS